MAIALVKTGKSPWPHRQYCLSFSYPFIRTPRKNPFLPRRHFPSGRDRRVPWKDVLCYLQSASAQTTLVDIGLKHNMFLTSDFSASPFATPEIDDER